MKLYHVLSILSVLIFIFFIVKYLTKKTYILYILYSFPFIDLPITPVEWGFIKVFDVISYLTLILFFKDIVFLKNKKKYGIYYILFLLYIIIIIVGGINSLYTNSSFFSILPVFSTFIYAKSIITECNKDINFKEKIIDTIKFLALISVVFLMIQLIAGIEFNFYPKLNRNTTLYGNIRYPSYFHDPQKYGQYLVLVSFLFLINSSYKINEQPKLKNYIMFLTMIIALLTTGGRLAIIGLVLGMTILFFILNNYYKTMFISLVTIASLIILNNKDQLFILNRAKDLDKDYLFRAALWEEAYKFFQTKPILGIGIGNYEKYAVHFSDNYYIEYNEVIFFDQPENGYLMILTEIGILGISILSLFILITIFKSIKTYFYVNRKITILLLITSIVSWLCTFISVYSLNDKRILIVVTTLISLLIVESTTNKTKYLQL